MSATRKAKRLPRLTSVGRVTVFGTLGCVLIAVLFNLITFSDMPAEVRFRGVISGIALPILLCVPMFFHVSVRLRQLAQTNRRLDLLARTDSLTACLNRGAFITRVEGVLTGETRPERGALLMVDADNFKSINDIYGHSVGDDALTIIARSIRAVLRAGDMVGRMGGEEFAVFLPGLNETQAALVAERVRRAVNLAVFQPDGKQRPLSVSVGGVSYERTASFHELFRIADQRLYSAKQAGRNRSILVSLEDHPLIDMPMAPANADTGTYPMTAVAPSARAAAAGA